MVGGEEVARDRREDVQEARSQEEGQDPSQDRAPRTDNSWEGHLKERGLVWFVCGGGAGVEVSRGAASERAKRAEDEASRRAGGWGWGWVFCGEE